MNGMFYSVLDMSQKAGFVILIVLAARLLLRRAPKLLSYLLWSAVLFRLICPVSLNAKFSLIPDYTPENGYSVTVSHPGVTITSLSEQEIESMNDAPDQNKTPSYDILFYLPLLIEAIWITGMIILTLYGIMASLRLRRRLKPSVRLRDNIYMAQHIATPFVYGLIRPRIYLPAGLSEQERNYVIRHEQVHIRRLDYVFRFVAFVALVVHWFNPLVWLAYYLSGKDMEMACDESTVKQLDNCRREYSRLLLKLGTGDTGIASPLSFGGQSLKSRIKNILRAKKLPVWITGVCLCVVIVVCAGLIADPKQAKELNGFDYDMEVTLEGSDDAIYPYWYEGGFDFKYDRLFSMQTDSSQAVLVFRSEDSSFKTMTVSEDFYSNSTCYRETYDLERGEDGTFRLPIPKRMKNLDEKGVYYLRFGNGVYVFQVELPAQT